MKLGYWTPPGIFHSVYKEKINYKHYRTHCQAKEDILGNSEYFIYPTYFEIPTKNNICKICFQENKREIIFLLTKIKLGI